jgi:predicted nucleic acid-binding protein
MPAKSFLDTNVLIYAFSASEPEKRSTARRLWLMPETWISTQVINETCSILTRKFKLPFQEAAIAVEQMVRTLPVLTVDVAIIRKALALAEQHPHNFYDALMLAAAVHLGCETLYSEDLQDGATIYGVRIIDPFAGDT